MQEFIPGRHLARAFFQEAVQPILQREFPSLRHAAALIGPGSEVLRFETPMSTDHHWGPRAMLFLEETEFAKQSEAIAEVMRLELPREFRGYPTNFTPPDSNDNGTQLLKPVVGGQPVNHRIELFTIRDFFREYLDVEIGSRLDAIDWLTIPSQKLLSISSGEVFHDAIGLADVCQQFRWYPREVWLYLMASEWSRIAQEEPFVGRAGEAGDERGSAIIATRLAHHLLRLSFLIEREYAPYSKWFGTAFARLRCARILAPVIDRILRSENWPNREAALSEASQILVEMHNTLGVTAPLSATASQFHGRPFKVIHADRIVEAIRSQIMDGRVKQISTNIGGIDVFSDSTDLLEATQLRRRLGALLE